MSEQAKRAIEQAEAMARACYPHLSGQPPELIGVALAELVSKWIGAHHPEVRDGVRERWWGLTNSLLEAGGLPLEAFEQPKGPLQ